jgi:RHS repeat-associated protein
MKAVWLMLASIQMAWATPVVTLTAPANNASYASPASITISADASDAGDSIAEVEFYSNGAFIGAASQVPYTVAWTNVAAGSYSITAKATNSAGASTVSAAVAVNVTGGSTTAGQPVAVYYIQPDHINTPRIITDSNNNVVWRWDNGEPFGSNVANENPSSQGIFSYNLRFPGQYYDKETNLHYNYFRDYDPSTGRYIESDPIGLDGGVNTYSYTLNNPLSFTDPTGQVALVDDAAVLTALGVGAILMSPPGQKAIKALGKAVADICKPNDDNKCNATKSRAEAMTEAYAWAGITPGQGEASPLPWKNNFNFPAGMSKGDRAFGDFMRQNNSPPYGYGTPGGAYVVEHPFGHPDLPGPAHHNCPHFHAKNAAGVERIFEYKS